MDKVYAQNSPVKTNPRFTENGRSLVYNPKIAVSRSIEEDPTTSTRRRSQELAISRSSLRRIQRDLHVYPFKVYAKKAQNYSRTKEFFPYNPKWSPRAAPRLPVPGPVVHDRRGGDDARGVPQLHVRSRRVVLPAPRVRRAVPTRRRAAATCCTARGLAVPSCIVLMACNQWSIARLLASRTMNTRILPSRCPWRMVSIRSNDEG
ncbi:hypothetical protein ACJJTC_007628 [Scirpophaga incertulas]